VLEHLRDPEIPDFGRQLLAIRIIMEEDVPGLQIPMEDIVAVDVSKPMKNLG